MAGTGGFKEGAWKNRPMPDDFLEKAPHLHISAAIRHWKAGLRAVNRWYAEAGLRPANFDYHARRPRPTVPAPDDFAQLAPTLTLRELMHHYRRGTKVIARWCKESGVSYRPTDRCEIMRRVQATRKRSSKPFQRRQPISRARRIVYNGPKSKPLPERDWSIHGQAADHLRPIAPVYRCSKRGGFDPKGDHYRFGNAVLTPDELLRRAKAKGWEAAF